jgi:type II secretory pathway component GspD/PulD (secretin)
MVRVVLSSKALTAEALVPGVKKLLGPLGQLTVVKGTNDLVLIDTVANLRAIRLALKDMDDPRNGPTWSYQCKACKASRAAEKLQEFLGSPRGTPPDKVVAIFIAADDRTNTIVVSGPPAKLDLAKEILALADLPLGSRPYPKGIFVLEAWDVRPGQAEVLVKMLRDVYAKEPGLRIATAGDAKILIYAEPADQMDIAVLLHDRSGLRTADTELLVFDAGTDVAKLAAMLTEFFGPRSKGAPVIEADVMRHTLIVHGSLHQIYDVKTAITTLGRDGGPSK